MAEMGGAWSNPFEWRDTVHGFIYEGVVPDPEPADAGGGPSRSRRRQASKPAAPKQSERAKAEELFAMLRGKGPTG